MKMVLDPPVSPPLGLRPKRVHEAGGRGRRSFALFQAARHPGPLVWITPAHLREYLLPAGLPAGVAERLHLLRPVGETDLLWCIEEVLRNPAVALVIAEPQQPLSLTAGRRLQLAAEAGQTTGLLLSHEGGGSAASETRWHCEPAPGSEDSTLHHWQLKKNKRGTNGDWMLHWDGATAAFHLVSKAGERHQPAEQAR
ncbi:ImuA family protein [Gemmobacter denitrificans]|uniref:Protein ImuA n=1 Tax=Gemmobacter denitrificans TaxID=3123040 RepID=A0ABU8C0P7_9RHOB